MLSGRKRICRLISFVLAVVIALCIFFAYVYYLDLRETFLAKVSSKATALIGQQVSIGDISVSFPLVIQLRDIQIRNPEGFVSGRLFKVKKIFLNTSYRDLLEGKLHFREIVLQSPELTVLKDREGRLNISDGLRKFLSKKGTLNYQVDELKILSGMADFNNNILLRSEKVNLTLKNLSSRPGTKTIIEGDTLLSGADKVRVNGWINLKDDPKKFRLSASAEDFSFSPFRAMAEKYHINLERTMTRFILEAEGDTDKGINLQSDIQVKSPGYGIYRKALLDISVHADAFCDLAADSVNIKTFTVTAGNAITMKAKGLVRDLRKVPSYNLKVNIGRVELAAFNFLRGVQATGMVTSDVIDMKGRLDDSLPEVSGVVRLEDAKVKADAAYVRNLNARILFSSDKESSAKVEGSAVIVKAGGHSLSQPAGVRLSLNAKLQRRDITFSASLTSSPFAIQIRERELSLKDTRVVTDGLLTGKTYSGKSSFTATGIQYADYSFNDLKVFFTADYEKNVLLIKGPKVETDRFSSSADMARIETVGRKDSFLIDAKNLNAAYPEKNASFSGLDFSLSLRRGDRDFSGDFQFSSAGVLFQEIKTGKISGRGAFNEKDFSLDMPRADLAGGMIRLIAEGKTSQGPFPVKVEASVEHIDLETISPAMEHYTIKGYRLSGHLENAQLKGIVDSKESMHGTMELDLKTFSLLNKKTGRYLLKDLSVHSEAAFKGADCEIKAAASAGNVAATISGTARKFMGEDREIIIQGQLPETQASEIRNSFWDSFPDALLYVGLEGAVASDFNVTYRKGGMTLEGNLRMGNFSIEGENSEYSMGPVNGMIPFAYGTFGEKGVPIQLPAFEPSEFERVSRYYADEYREDGYHKITIGSLQYGFRMLDNITVWIKQDKGVLNVGRFSANIFGGRLNGSAAVETADGLHYRAGMILEGASLKKLCDDIYPIKGYISGKVDGIGMVKGSGTGLPELIGKADFWTYSGRDEKTRISGEFLQKLGGASLKSYLGDRDFDKGKMSLYMQKGYFIFRELEISNRNIFGIKDLSVKVAPFNNRISIDRLMWTIVEAAHRAKKN
jgi:hypothetical protein